MLFTRKSFFPEVHLYFLPRHSSFIQAPFLHIVPSPTWSWVLCDVRIQLNWTLTSQILLWDTLPSPQLGQTFSTLEQNLWPALAVWRHFIPIHWSMCLSLCLLLNYRFCNGSQYLVGQVTPLCSSVEASLQNSVLLDKNLTHPVPGGESQSCCEFDWGC